MQMEWQNSVDPERISLIWVYSVYSCQFVGKLRIIMATVLFCLIYKGGKTEQTIHNGKVDFIWIRSTRFGHTVTFIRTKWSINLSTEVVKNGKRKSRDLIVMKIDLDSCHGNYL